MASESSHRSKREKSASETDSAPGAPTEKHPLDGTADPIEEPGAPTERHPADFAGK